MSGGRADVALVASVVVLFGARFVFGEEGPQFATSFFGDLGTPLFAAIVSSAALAVLAVRWSQPFGGAVRALVAAIAFFTLAVDPTLEFHGNGWYALPGIAFAYTALSRNSRRRLSDQREGKAGAPNALAAGATSLVAGLLLAGVGLVVLVVIFIFWSLGDSS